MSQPISDDDAVIANLPDLTIAVSHAEDMVILEQRDYAGDAARVAVHKWQVRMLAEHFGLLPAPPRMPEAEVARSLRTQLADSARTVSMMARRMYALKARIDHLQHYLANCSDHEHANLEYETDYATLTRDLSDEFCAELGDISQRFGYNANASEPVQAASAAEPSSKACANPYGKAIAKASVKASAAGTDSLFGSDHG